MKKAFTLVELLVVTAVIAILSSIVFRVTSSAGASEARQKTINRLQRLENCLSGYYAAFGSYPPVAVEGSRNPFYKLNEKGNQQTDESPDTSTLDWGSVEKACRSQPVKATFPFNGDNDAGGNLSNASYPKKMSEAVQKLMSVGSFSSAHQKSRAAKGFDAGAANKLVDNEGKTFRFGLISYLIPRAVTMMKGSKKLYTDCAQWVDNNNLPCRFSTGVPYESWGALHDIVLKKNGDASEQVMLDLIPSQAVCRRWIANLEGVCRCQADITPFGVQLCEKQENGSPTPMYDPKNPEAIDKDLEFIGDPLDNSASEAWLPNKITVNDGWGNEFYYYSPPPFQSYRIWSAGENGKTFPPWVTDDQLQTDGDLKRHAPTIHTWIADDIVHMSN